MSQPVQLADGVVGLGTDYVNWFLVSDDSGVTVVDAGIPGYRPQLEPGLKLLGRTPGDIRAVLLTHGDADHVGVAAAIRNETGAPVHIHRGDADMVANASRKKTDGSPLPLLVQPTAWRVLAHFARNGAMRPSKLPDTVALEDGATVDVPGRPRVIHTPGHTPGHTVLHFEGHGALFVGDALCTWNVATGRRGPQLLPKPFNVSYQQAHASLERIEGLAADLMLVGHGDPWKDGPASAVERARASSTG